MKNVSLYIDLAFCVVVLPIMMMIFPIERWYHHFPWYVVSVGVWLYFLYFLNRLITVPYLFGGGKRVVAAVLMIALSFAVTYMFSEVTLYPPRPSVHDRGIDRYLPHVLQYQQAIWSLFMIVEAYSFAVGLLVQTNEQRAQRRAVEAERDRAEIELYRAQIKPHFLFNTLNSLYGLFLTHSDKALESLEKFISMMRYVHTTAERDLVPLSDEVDYIRQYVGLQSLRLNDKTHVSLDTDIDDEGLMVPPMLLVTFVENCFKHGVSPVEESRISISLHEHGGKLLFKTCNSIFPARRIGEHMGIENCRRRLGILYPGRHRLSISDDGSLYNVVLSIEPLK